MSQSRTYPDGVPSWVDTEQPDPRAAQEFYGRLLGWTFTTVSQPDAPFYAMATLDEGRDVAGLSASSDGSAVWNTYVAVDDADVTAARVWAAGGEVSLEPADVGEAGRVAICRDPAGAEFRLWQARRRPGAQKVNEPGSWNFSDLHTDRAQTIAFYGEVFGWAVEDLGFATLVRRPGYGDHLEATVDPDIRRRQAEVTAPPGFEDAIAWVAPLEPGAPPHWHVTLAVADRDATASAAQALGADVLSTEDSQWTRTALVRDPQGAVFTASQFTPPTR
ncbi:MAG: VOC family protein [Solirubrobacteraceae bacterium]